MTAKDREIQRYFIGFDGAEIPHDRGNVVLYADHLRAVKLAQVEALRSLPIRIDKAGDGHTYLERFIQLKIAALRKELEGPISAEPETTANRITNRGWIDE